MTWGKIVGLSHHKSLLFFKGYHLGKPLLETLIRSINAAKELLDLKHTIQMFSSFISYFFTTHLELIQFYDFALDNTLLLGPFCILSINMLCLLNDSALYH